MKEKLTKQQLKRLTKKTISKNGRVQKHQKILYL